MACIRSPNLSDGELLAYLAGDADPGITAHLVECTTCRQRVDALAMQEKQLQSSLYRLHCPPSLTLGEYQMGFLSAAETRAIDHHLQHCQHCHHELQVLTAYLAEVAPTLEIEPSRSLWARSRTLVARLAEELPNLGSLPGLPPSRVLAAAGVRGEAGAQLVYTVEDVQVVIDVQSDTEDPTHQMLLGLVLGLAVPQHVTAHLWRADQPVATALVDELGNFIISALPPGTYDLILSDEKTEVHLPSLVI